MTLIDLIRRSLRQIGVDGLGADECGCFLEDLCPCDAPDLRQCEPAWRCNRTGDNRCPDCDREPDAGVQDWHTICTKKPHIRPADTGKPELDPEKFGSHKYPQKDGTHDCMHGCGCWMGPYRSGGPVDPYGPCPENPIG